MIATLRCLTLFLSCLIPLYSAAEAPVVDDSENYAILENQQGSRDPSVDEEIALAQDNTSGQEIANDVPSQIKTMQQEIQELRGQLEVQTHALQVLQQQTLAFYKDIDARLQPNAAAEKTGPTALNTPIISLPTALETHNNNPADEQISYLAAYDLVKNRRFEEALTAMQAFVTKYPKGGYTANAQYWLGELYMVKKDYPEAIKHFEIVLKNFSTSSKSAACSLKIGYALASSGKKDEARRRLQQVIKNYPDTPTAQLAATKLIAINAS